MEDIGCDIYDGDDDSYEESHTIYLKVNDELYTVNYIYEILSERTAYSNRKVYVLDNIESFNITKCTDDITICKHYNISIYSNDDEIEKIKETLEKLVGEDKIDISE